MRRFGMNSDGSITRYFFTSNKVIVILLAAVITDTADTLLKITQQTCMNAIKILFTVTSNTSKYYIFVTCVLIILEKFTVRPAVLIV